ncbi:unnamed protein product [Spirodela intermedia]|uniref:Uncharacterized protein n=1 Tax=Spirodela intermedia TaxID=51605 RepID=A0ABN7EBF4_SPIIN|nr:unnamed protein product [Spirodela intermedia]
MKWVVESSSTAVTRRSRKTVTLRLSVAVTRQRGARWRWGACHGALSLGLNNAPRIVLMRFSPMIQ